MISEGKIDQSTADQMIDANRNEIGNLNRKIGRMQFELREIEKQMDDFRDLNAARG